MQRGIEKKRESPTEIIRKCNSKTAGGENFYDLFE